MGKLNLILLLLLGMALVTTGRVAAHAELVRAEPRLDAELREPPTQIRLTFNEAVAAGSTLRVITADFTTLDGVTLVESNDPNVLAATLPPLPAGRYTVEYDVLSTDGHSVLGSYRFTVDPDAGGWGAGIAGLVLGIAGALIVTSLLVFRARRAQLIARARAEKAD